MKLTSFFASLGLEVDGASFATGIAAVEGVRIVLAGLKEIAHDASEAFIGFNASVEAMKMRLTTMAQMNLKVPFEEAKAAADHLFEGLQEDALKTPATTRELTDFAAQVAGVVLKAGKSMDDLRAITGGTVVLAKSQDMGQYAAIQTQEALMGVVRVNQRFSRFMIEQAMGMTRAQFIALDPAKRIEKWTAALQSPAVKQAMKEYETNWAGVTSSIVDIKEIVLGAIGKPLFEELKVRLLAFKNWLLSHRKDIEEFGGKLMNVFLAFIRSIERIGKLAAKEFDVFMKKLKEAGIPISKLDLAMGALVIAMTLATAAAVGLAIRMAIAFTLAAAPVLALGAILAIIYLIVEDIIVGLNGGHSVLRDLYHEWQDFLRDFSKPQEGDSWFTTLLRDWARLLSDVRVAWWELKHDILSTDGFKDWIKSKIPMNPLPDGRMVDADEALRYYEDHPTRMKADARYEAGPFHSGYTGTLGRDAAPAPGNTFTFGDTTISVVAPPGADADELGKIVGKSLQDFWDKQMRRAAPGVAQ